MHTLYTHTHTPQLLIPSGTLRFFVAHMPKISKFNDSLIMRANGL